MLHTMMALATSNQELKRPFLSKFIASHSIWARDQGVSLPRARGPSRLWHASIRRTYCITFCLRTSIELCAEPFGCISVACNIGAISRFEADSSPGE